MSVTASLVAESPTDTDWSMKRGLPSSGSRKVCWRIWSGGRAKPKLMLASPGW